MELDAPNRDSLDKPGIVWFGLVDGGNWKGWMMPPNDDNGWSAYEKLVMSELKRLREKQDVMSAKLTGLCADVSALKVKAGVWGVLGGMLTGGVALVWMLVRGK